MAAIAHYNPLAVNVGAVGGPSFSFLGETSTGVYLPASGIVGVSILGTEKLRVTATGLIIGTTTDDGVNALQVNGSLSLATALAAQYGGTGFGTYVLGDLLYASGTTALSKLSGNTTNTRKFLREQGSAGLATAPAWDTLTVADIPALPTPTGSSIRALMLMGG